MTKQRMEEKKAGFSHTLEPTDQAWPEPVLPRDFPLHEPMKSLWFKLLDCIFDTCKWMIPNSESYPNIYEIVSCSKIEVRKTPVTICIYRFT